MSNIDEFRYVYVHLLTYFTSVQLTPIIAHGHGAQARPSGQPAVLLPPRPPTLVLRPALDPLQPSLQALLSHKLAYYDRSICIAEGVNTAVDRRALLAPSGAKLRRARVGLGAGDHWRAPPGLGQVGRAVGSQQGAAEGAEITQVSRRCTEGRARRSGRARRRVGACSGRPRPQAGRWWQRGGAHQ